FGGRRAVVVRRITRVFGSVIVVVGGGRRWRKGVINGGVVEKRGSAGQTKAPNRRQRGFCEKGQCAAAPATPCDDLEVGDGGVGGVWGKQTRGTSLITTTSAQVSHLAFNSTCSPSKAGLMEHERETNQTAIVRIDFDSAFTHLAARSQPRSGAWR
ncbi:6852_t:CDS:2, partial [Acaulospora colombiana]